eukprot:6931712-Prymnesium_polylepis.3
MTSTHPAAEQETERETSALRLVMLRAADRTAAALTERKLAAHLQRLPPEGENFVVTPQERCRLAQRGWALVTDRAAAEP